MLQVASSRRKTQTPARKLALVATLTGLAGRLGIREAMAGCSGLSTNSPPKQIRIPNLTDSYPSEVRKIVGRNRPGPQETVKRGPQLPPLPRPIWDRPSTYREGKGLSAPEGILWRHASFVGFRSTGRAR